MAAPVAEKLQVTEFLPFSLTDFLCVKIVESNLVQTSSDFETMWVVQFL